MSLCCSIKLSHAFITRFSLVSHLSLLKMMSLSFLPLLPYSDFADFDREMLTSRLRATSSPRLKALERLSRVGKGGLYDNDEVGLLDDDRITEEGAPYVFKKSEDQKSAQSRGQQRQLHSRFTVFVRNRHTSVINVVKFQEKPLPSTLEEFWNITGVDGTIDSARVVVKMPTGWEKLSGEPKDANRYVADDPDLGVMFQLSPSNTPNSSPTREEYREITPVQGESAFRECVQGLFNENPFTDAVPSLYKDEAIAMLEDFFRQSSDCLDPKVVALILAMPGSGKTRTVQEAARSLDLGYHKFRMSTIKFVTAEDVRQYVERKIKEICGVAGNNSIPIDGMKKIVIHFDEIQTMMKEPKNGEENCLVTSLAIACDGLVHDQEGRHRSWLKFVITGTNIFTDEMINIGSEVKTDFIPMDGSFSLNFVTQVANEHDLISSFGKRDDGYLERCRHNRRFTERFFFQLWRRSRNGPDRTGSVVEDAYEAALDEMCRQISGNMKTENSRTGNVRTTSVPISKVACAVFAKILLVDPKVIVDGVTTLTGCSKIEKAYIGGGGLNVKQMSDDDISIFYPDGCVLELLERMVGRRSSRHCCKTIIAFLRVNAVLRFGIRGHLFEWLIAYDITSPRSELNALMSQNRLNACVGSVPVSDPKICEIIAPTMNSEANVWVVLDEHNSHQNRWIDVAYSIEVPPDTEYRAAYVIMECKTGYRDRTSQLAGFCQEFFKAAAVFAFSKPDYYFVAVFACEHTFSQKQGAATAVNLETAVKVITTESCPAISRFLRAGTTSMEDVEDMTDEVRAMTINDGSEPEFVYPGGTPQGK